MQTKGTGELKLCTLSALLDQPKPHRDVEGNLQKNRCRKAAALTGTGDGKKGNAKLLERTFIEIRIYRMREARANTKLTLHAMTCMIAFRRLSSQVMVWNRMSKSITRGNLKWVA